MQFIIKELDIETVRFDIAMQYHDRLKTLVWFVEHNYEAWAAQPSVKDDVEAAFKSLQAIRVGDGDVDWKYVWAYFQELPEETVLAYFKHRYDKDNYYGDDFDWRWDNNRKKWMIVNIEYW